MRELLLLQRPAQLFDGDVLLFGEHDGTARVFVGAADAAAAGVRVELGAHYAGEASRPSRDSRSRLLLPSFPVLARACPSSFGVGVLASAHARDVCARRLTTLRRLSTSQPCCRAQAPGRDGHDGAERRGFCERGQRLWRRLLWRRRRHRRRRRRRLRRWWRQRNGAARLGHIPGRLAVPDGKPSLASPPLPAACRSAHAGRGALGGRQQRRRGWSARGPSPHRRRRCRRRGRRRQQRRQQQRQQHVGEPGVGEHVLGGSTGAAADALAQQLAGGGARCGRGARGPVSPGFLCKSTAHATLWMQPYPPSCTENSPACCHKCVLDLTPISTVAHWV